MLIEDFLKIIEDALPPETGMEGDRLGLQVQTEREDINKILITLEVNNKVIEEAVSTTTDTIITFHPLIFNPLTSIRETDRVGKLASTLIKNSINLISVHTNFDAFRHGTSHIFANRLGLEVVEFLYPSDSYPGHGMGVVAKPVNPMTKIKLLELIGSVCNSPLRYSQGKPVEKIEKIAIVCGSGMSFYDFAVAHDTDVFITADISYHNFHRATDKIMLIDPGHYEMEQFVPLALHRFIVDTFDKTEFESVNVTGVHTNPVSYFPDSNFYKKKQEEYLINNQTV